MSESSLFWTTGATGDGASPYTQAQLFAWLRRTLISDNAASEGVLVGYNNGLAVSGTSSPVAVATGAAVVYGIPYENDASLNVTIPTPVSQTRIDRIVLRASWSAQTVRITRIAGTEGAGEPALTQTANTTWDIPLAKVSITTGGVITVTDERVYAHFASAVRSENLDASLTLTTPKVVGPLDASSTVGASTKPPLNYVPLDPSAAAYTESSSGNKLAAAITLSGLPSSAVAVSLLVFYTPGVSNGLMFLTPGGSSNVALRLIGPSASVEYGANGVITCQAGSTNQIKRAVTDSGSWILSIYVLGYWEPA